MKCYCYTILAIRQVMYTILASWYLLLYFYFFRTFYDEVVGIVPTIYRKNKEFQYTHLLHYSCTYVGTNSFLTREQFCSGRFVRG